MNQLYVYIHLCFCGFLSHLDHHRALSSLCYTVGSHQLPISYIASLVYKWYYNGNKIELNEYLKGNITILAEKKETVEFFDLIEFDKLL